MFKKHFFLLLSVFLHLIVIYVVAQSVMFPSEPDSPAKKNAVIQATLIFDFPAPTPDIPDEITKAEVPTPEEPEESLTITETPKVPTPPITPQPQVMPPQHEEEAQQKPEKSAEVKNMIPTEQNIEPTENSNIQASATNMARRHLSSFQQQQQNRVAEQASRYYQQHKNSPVINDALKDPFMSEDEKVIQNLKVRADCSSTSKKTTAVLLGFLGAQIDCSKPPPISGFIQDRIHKQPHSSGPSNQEEIARPQSVVIKKQP